MISRQYSLACTLLHALYMSSSVLLVFGYSNRCMATQAPWALASNVQSQNTLQQQPEQPANRQRIVVLCSQGGYTHLSLAKVIKQVIGHHYDIDIVYIFDETFDNFGTKIQRHIIGKDGSDAFYNRLLSQDKRKTLNFLVKYMARGYYRSNRRRVSELIAKHIQHPRTAMLISVVPFVNGAAMLAAKQRNIPLMVVSVDSNLAIWLADATRPFYPSCVWLLPYNLSSMHQQLHRAGIPHNAFAFAGLPVRQQFFHPHRGVLPGLSLRRVPGRLW